MTIRSHVNASVTLPCPVRTHDHSMTNVPPCSLVTGASSGIGLAFTEHLLTHTHDRVVAVSRRAQSSPGLLELAARHRNRLVQLEADLTNESELSGLGDTLAGAGLRPHRVINCAGMLHGEALPDTPEKRLEQVSKQTLKASFAINAFAPILLARALLPLMPREPGTVFASLSARVGSIGDNRLGGWYAYRAAKAAQNQLLRTLAVEAQRRWPGLRVLLLHPGTTDTPLSEPFQSRVPTEKLFAPQWVAERLMHIIDTTSEQDSGRFIDWQGKDVPW